MAKRGVPQSMIGDRVAEIKINFLNAPHPALEIEIKYEKVDDISSTAKGRSNLEELQIYTDGSKIGGKVGAALTCWKNGKEVNKKKFLLEPYCTVYQAEMYALYRATDLAIQSKDQCINIYSDSRSSLDTIKNINSYNPLAFEIRQNLINSKIKQKIINLFWIRAHAGVEGNERADKLAKEAALTKKTAPDYSACPIAYIKSNVRQNSLKIWQERYSKTDKATVTKMFFPDVCRANVVLRKIKLSPTLVQVMTGHGGFNQYLNRFKLKESPECECDPAEIESVVHLLTQCPKFGKSRFETTQYIDQEINEKTISKIIENKHIRVKFLEYCENVAIKIIKKNKDR